MVKDHAVSPGFYCKGCGERVDKIETGEQMLERSKDINTMGAQEDSMDSGEPK
jgi:hypothetical protein